MPSNSADKHRESPKSEKEDASNKEKGHGKHQSKIQNVKCSKRGKPTKSSKGSNEKEKGGKGCNKSDSKKHGLTKETTKATKNAAKESASKKKKKGK